MQTEVINKKQILAIKVADEHKSELFDFLINLDSVSLIRELENDFDFFVDIIAETMEDYLDLVECLYETFEVIESRDFSVVKEIKKN